MNVEWESPWTAPGEWLLGNLHTHTKLSDGSLPVDETAGVYRNGGYDFLAVTDHAVLFEHEQQRPDGLLLVGGCLETTLLTDAMEMLALGVDQAPEIVREVTTGQEAIDRIRAANGIALFATEAHRGDRLSAGLPAVARDRMPVPLSDNTLKARRGLRTPHRTVRGLDGRRLQFALTGDPLLESIDDKIPYRAPGDDPENRTHPCMHGVDVRAS